VPGGSQSSSTSRDWRAQARSDAPTSGVKYIRRGLLTLLVALLAMALVYLLLSSPAEIHFAVLPVTGSDTLTLPPIPYGREDGNSLGEIQLRPPVLDLQDIQTARGIDTLASKLREGLHSSDTLIVYVAGNCVSDLSAKGPEAWLLCSDFALSRESGGTEPKLLGRYRLRDLLAQLKQCKARCKLLILESGCLNYDPRLGMFVNESPRLLEEDVRAVDDPDLWVLCSCRPMETPHFCGAEKRSVFNYFVAEALTGAANRDSRWVELNHFFSYVRKKVGEWVDRQTGGLQSQTPWLLHRGGLDNPPQNFRLVPILIRKPPPKDAPTDATTADAAPPAKPTPATQLAIALADSWQRRDRLQDRTLSRAGWTPVDYAPHLWREYQELLIGIDRRSRAGLAFDPVQLSSGLLQDLSLDERSFLDASGSSPASNVPVAARAQSIASRLVEARKRFLERMQADRYFVDANPLREAIQWKNDLMMRAPYYVRWNVAASRSSAGRGPLDQELGKMLLSLASLTDRLELLQAASTPSPSEQVGELLDALKDSHRRIEQIIDNKVAAVEQHPDAIVIHELLDAPLLTAATRKRLLAARDRLSDALPGDAPQKTLALPSLGGWSNSIRQQAELDRQLVGLASPEFRFASLEEPLARGDSAAVDSRFWKIYGQFGQELGRFYGGLPEEIRKLLASSDSTAANRCDRCLRLLDARDAASVPDDVLNIVLPHPRATLTPSLVAQAEAPSTADADGQYVVRLLIDKTDLPATFGLVSFEFPRRELVLTTADGKQAIVPEEPFRAELRPGRTQLAFKARAQVQSGAETSLAITVRCGDKSRQCQVRLVLPQPDVVLLRAIRLVGNLDGSVDRRQESESTLQFDHLTPQRLEPFPNRSTTYTFEMINRSGLAKKLQVRVYALPEWFWDRKMTCRQACDALARTGNLLGESAIELAQLGKPEKFAFPAFKGPPKKVEEKPADKAAEKPPKPEPDKPKVDVSQGLVIVVSNANVKEPEPRWIQVFSFAPLRPSRYLEPTVHYDVDQGKLEIEVSLAADRDLPPCSQKAPVRLTMTVRDDSGRAVALLAQPDAGLRGQTKALLYPARPRDVLYAPVRSNGRDPIQVELNVDDYPRAFLYDVSLNKVTNQRDLWRIRLFTPPRDPVSAFQPRETLPVKFNVDAPEDSFLARQSNSGAADVVQVEIFDEQHPESSRPLRFYSDRQVKVDLEEADAEGEMKITAKVDDFATEVDAHGLENVIARIHGQILRDRQPKDEDALRVILDGRPPEFELALASDRVAKGTDIQVTANVIRTLSAMGKFEYGFQGEVEKQFKDKTKSVEVRGRSASFVLPTKELDPGEHVVLVRGENKAGNSDFRAARVTIFEPPPPTSDKPAGPTTITVRGTVRWLDGSPASGVEVSIENPARSAKSDAQGKFAFTDLPRGSYTIKAKGSTGGMRASGEAKADPGSQDTANVDLSLSSLNR
jgi:hypothetical protein